jgi:hypothetical protein
VQLVVGDVVDVELARALERRRAEVRREEHAVEQLRAARAAAALGDDALDLAREALQRVAQARIGRIGDHGGVVGGEDLRVRVMPVSEGGWRRGESEGGEQGDRKPSG